MKILAVSNILVWFINLIFSLNQPEIRYDEPIIDSNYSFEEAVAGKDIPKEILNKLVLVQVEYYSFDKKLHQGQLVVNKNVENEIKEIFEFIKISKFPVNKVVPISRYGWSDEKSMKDNNTSSFNYRNVRGQKVLSAHSYGLAIDINPKQNPHVKGKLILPSDGRYDKSAPGTITKDSQLLKEFKKRGWQWGGAWRSSKDYQHFEKK